MPGDVFMFAELTTSAEIATLSVDGGFRARRLVDCAKRIGQRWRGLRDREKVFWHWQADKVFFAPMRKWESAVIASIGARLRGFGICAIGAKGGCSIE